MFDRTDEADFRANVPLVISGFRVLEVIGFHPGGQGWYAYAYAITRKASGHYSTHRIICQDDYLERLRWILESGNYDLETRRDATVDLMKRAGWA